MTRSAIDSNIALYALADRRSQWKTDIARRLLLELAATNSCVISTQVLKEFSNVATKKLRPTLSEIELRQHLDDLIELDVVVVDVAMTLAAVKRHYVSKISFYDSLVVESSIAGGARVLYSEDLQHGQIFDTVEIVNPFL